MLKNYYQILNVLPDASNEEIKKAYRLYVSKFHPDKHGNDEFFKMRFLEIQEAYEVLSDDKERNEYDAMLFGNNSDYDEAEDDTVDFDGEPYVKLFVNHKKIKFGDTVKFVWETENVRELTIVGHGKYPVNGDVTFTPTKNTDYIFIFSNDNETVKKDITIEVKKSVDTWAVVLGIIIFIIYMFFL